MNPTRFRLDPKNPKVTPYDRVWGPLTPFIGTMKAEYTYQRMKV